MVNTAQQIFNDLGNLGALPKFHVVKRDIEKTQPFQFSFQLGLEPLPWARVEIEVSEYLIGFVPDHILNPKTVGKLESVK